MFRQLGAPEILLILLVVVLLFGAKKLPDLARGSGRALRIFKAETKGLLEDDDDTVKDTHKTPEELALDARRKAEAAQRLDQPVAQPVEQPVEQPHPHTER